MNRPLLRSLSHPLTVLAVGTLLVNDHILKARYPSWVTGKLSDAAGLVFFPLVVGALVESAIPAARRRPLLVLVMVGLTVGSFFGAIQLIPAATEAYQLAMGALRLPFRVIVDPAARFTPVAATPDPTDLVALPALALTWLIARRSGVVWRTSDSGGSALTGR